MTLYDIDSGIAELLSAVDPETGELLCDDSALDALLMERTAKIENIACYIKNLRADAAAIRAEEKALAERRQKAERSAERLSAYLAHALGGERFETPRCSVSFRSSVAVELSPGFTEWAKQHDDSLLRYKEPEPDKAAIKAALTSGRELECARLSRNTSVTVR